MRNDCLVISLTVAYIDCRFRMTAARRLLRQLRLSRFGIHRWKFYAYFRRRLRKSLDVIRAFRYFHFRSAYLAYRRRIKNARCIQRFYRGYRFRQLARLMVQVSKLAQKSIHHCIYFADRRAFVKIVQARRLNYEEYWAGNIILKAWKRHFRQSRLDL